MKKHIKSKVIKSSLIVSISATALSPIGIALMNNLKNNSLLEKYSAAQNFDKIPEINTPTTDMFINTENIISLSSTKKGVAVTPYGWLGTYSKRTSKNPGGPSGENDDTFHNNALILIGWDGSILWANRESNIKIHSVKYNFSTNTIFVIRTQDNTGIGDTSESDRSFRISLTIHDALTGKQLYDSNDQNWNWRFSSNVSGSNIKLNEKLKDNLFFQDMITLNNGDILWYYLPNPIQMNNNNNNEETTMATASNYKNFLKSESSNWDNDNLNAKVLIFKKTDLDNAKKNNIKINATNVSNLIFRHYENWVSNDNLIAAPIFVPSKTNNSFALYFFKSNLSLNNDNNEVKVKAYTRKYTYNPSYSNLEQIITSDENNSNNDVEVANKIELNKSLVGNNIWSDEFLNANLLPTRNIFDETIITVPYPYAARNKNNEEWHVGDGETDVKVPIFNVVQLHFEDINVNSQNIGDGNKSISFNFGTKIYNNWLTNKLYNKNPQENTGGQTLFWNPWPFANKNIGDYVYNNQSYNRLISVSPFDGTVVYASRSYNVRYSMVFDYGGIKWKDLYDTRKETQNKWASFWIGQAQGDLKGRVANLLIDNSLDWFQSEISGDMIKDKNVDDLYTNGFWFDPVDKKNLYYQVTGWSQNKQQNNTTKSTPIGLIGNTLGYIDINNLTNKHNTIGGSGVGIILTNQYYSNFIASRADLKKWYKRTWQNYKKGFNTYNENGIVLDESQNNDISNRAKVEDFNKVQKDPIFKTNKSIDLYSAWDVSNNNKNKIVVKGPKIVSLTTDDDLKDNKFKLKFSLTTKISNEFLKESDKNKAQVFEENIEILGPLSLQFINSWGNNLKFDIQNNNKLSVSIVDGNSSLSNRNWASGNNLGYFDQYDPLDHWRFTPINSYDTNDQTKNPLRIELQIDYDPNNLGDSNSYIQKLKTYDNGKFTKSYPIWGASNDESSFETILQDYIDWKTENMDWLTENLKSDASPGNISIKAFVKLNPYWEKNKNLGTVYQIDESTQVLIDKNNNNAYIYHDQYNSSRYIYKQTSSQWTTNNDYGFGTKVNDDVKLSWKTMVPSNNFVSQIKDINKLKDDLVRINSTQTSDKIFSVAFSEDSSSLVLSIKNMNYENWTKNHFKKYNQMLGKRVAFEYLTQSSSNSNEWKEINKKYFDNDFDNIQWVNEGFNIPLNGISESEKNSITHVRFVLKDINDANQLKNKITDSSMAKPNDSSKNIYTSDAIEIKKISINIDYNKDVSLNIKTTNNNTNYLNSATKEQIKTGLKDVEEQYLKQNNVEGENKEYIELKYYLDENFDNAYTLEDVVEKIYEKLNKFSDFNQGGIVNLYDKTKSNTKEVTKIGIRFFLKNPNLATSVKLTETNWENGNKYIQKTSNKYLINLKNYVDQLKNSLIDFDKKNNQNGTIQTIRIPNHNGKIGESFLFGWSFEQIENLFEKFGIKIQYSTKENEWKENLSDIDSYETSNPKLRIKFIYNGSEQIDLTLDGSSYITSEQIIELTLNAPILIKLDENTFNTSFKNQKPVTGNTYKIEVDKEKEKNFIEKIKEFSTKGTTVFPNPNPWDKIHEYLEIKYALGEITNETVFYSSQEFINHYSTSNEVQYNNKVSVKIILKESGKGAFVLDSSVDKTWTLIDKDDKDFKIFIHGDKYEEMVSQIQVRGSTSNLEIILPNKLKEIKDNKIQGLKIEFSLKPNISYDDNNSDINNGWNADLPTSITNQKILSIRIKNTEDKYLYGNKQGGQIKTVHQIDLTQITQLVDVNKNWFSEIDLSISGDNKYLSDLQVSDIISWENRIWEKSIAIKTNSEIKEKLTIKYTIEGVEGSFNSTSLVAKIKQMEKDYNGSSLGIVQLWNEQIGTKINATFATKDGVKNIVFISDTNNPDSINTDLTGIANTKNIKTLVDLSSYINKITSTKIDTEFEKNEASFSNITSFTPPMLDGSDGGFLVGKTYDAISSRLENTGISFIYNNDLDNNSNWVEKKEIKSYNKNKALLYLGFKFSNKLTSNNNIVLKINNNQANQLINGTYQEKNIILTLDAPLELVVNNDELDKLKFEGHTKIINNIESIKTNIQTILDQVKNNNKDNVKNTLNQNLNDLELEIRFSLNNLKLKNDSMDSQDGVWFTIEELNQILINSKINYDSNKVIAKFYVKNNPKIKEFDKYHFSVKEPKVINEENKENKTNFNIYINNVQETTENWIIENLKLYGSQENFTLTNYEQWLSKVPKGLSIQYNVVPNNSNNGPNENSWKDNFDDAKPINVTRDYWIRFKVGNAYVFESALTNNASYSKAFKLDASNIQIALKIKNEWLKTITLNDNLKNLKINEDSAINEIKNAGMMPIDEIIQVQYTFDGNEWLTKDLFIQKLVEIDKDTTSNKWFILREDVKARFALNKQINDAQNPKYILDIDGVNISEDNSNNQGINLITTELNSSVKGYINIDRFPEFVASNFEVKGTNVEAFLNIKNVNKLNEKLQPYSSSNVFSILYKWEQNDSYEESNKVWTPGQDLQEKIKLNGDYQKRYFGIQFKIKDSNYELYKNDKKLSNNEHEITSPNIKVEISVEILNPLIDKTIVIKYLDNNSAVFFNNDGGFEVKIDNKSFTEFINSTSLPQDQKDALELTYYVSSTQLSSEELAEIQKPENINKYDESNEKYGIWKTLDTNSSDWKSRNLKLKVNDYVVLALRIKKDKITSETNQNGYVLKDNNHTPTDQKRVFGYKIHTSNVDVDWQTLKLRNVGLAENAAYGLDGYAMLDQIQLKSTNTNDSSNDYLNVGLSLDFFNEFHVNSSNQVLVSASGARLVKRDSNGATTDGYYKDIDGNDIKDKDNNTIPILYTDKDRGILAPPIKANTKQRSHDLIEQTSNRYTLELNSNEENALYSFFKNQDIAITFKNKKGDAEGDLFDYYVDQENVLKTYKITDLIKFPIANDNLIQYKFNSEEFNDFIKDPNNLNTVYQNSVDSSKNPINSQSKMIYTYKVVRTAEKEEAKTLNTISEIMNQIKSDFGQKVKLKTTYISVNGVNQDVPSNELSSITTLQNGDRFKVEILSANENDLIFAQQPAPLIFTINGLYEQDIDASILKFLRVEQKGQYEGQGSFNIYVDDPSTDRDNNIPLASHLQGYNFLIKVWNKNKEVKQNWTNDLGLITNLNNGDKVEWKLVAPSGAPIQNAYYNTVANMDKHDANNNQYSFIQVAKKGNNSTTIYRDGIGQNPENDNVYPENSGFIIDGLIEKPAQVIPQLTIEQFINIMNYMNFTYTGINGLGNMVSERNISNITVGTYKNSRETFTLKDLIDQEIITFYANNNRFNWTQIRDKNGNWIVAPGNLLNGDLITVRYQDSTMASYYEWKAPTVSGLKEKNDNMSLLMYVGIGMASLVTLGVFGLIYIIARNKKLKNKK